MAAFWLTPLGIFSLVAIFVTSLINIYAKFIDDSFLDRIVFSAMALVSLAALLHVVQGELPQHVGIWVVVLMAIKQCTSVASKALRWYMGRKKYALPRRS